MPAFAFAPWVMPPNSAGAQACLKLTTHTLFANNTNTHRAENLTGVELHSKHSLKLVHQQTD